MKHHLVWAFKKWDENCLKQMMFASNFLTKFDWAYDRIVPVSPMRQVVSIFRL